MISESASRCSLLVCIRTSHFPPTGADEEAGDDTALEEACEGELVDGTRLYVARVLVWVVPSRNHAAWRSATTQGYQVCVAVS
jgi:hypothetical protein